MEIEYGCRSEYGPLELRIQATAQENGFLVYVEDRRLEPPGVQEHAVQSSLESAKEYAVAQADEYLASRQDPALHEAKWRCS